MRSQPSFAAAARNTGLTGPARSIVEHLGLTGLHAAKEPRGQAKTGQAGAVRHAVIMSTAGSRRFLVVTPWELLALYGRSKMQLVLQVPT